MVPLVHLGPGPMGSHLVVTTHNLVTRRRRLVVTEEGGRRRCGTPYLKIAHAYCSGVHTTSPTGSS